MNAGDFTTMAASCDKTDRRPKQEQGARRIGKTDVWLLGMLLLAGCAGLGFVSMQRTQAGSRVQLQVNGKMYGTYSLEKEQAVPVSVHGKVTNTLQIADGKAKMVEADCPDQLCIHQRAIAKRGETIVCLPNKVVAEVVGEEAPELDAVSQ